MHEITMDTVTKTALYLSMLLPLCLLVYCFARPGNVHNLQKLDGYVYRAYIVITFCCVAQVMGGLQNLAYATDYHLAFVSSLFSIMQTLIFGVIVYCMTSCAKKYPTQEEQK